MKVAQAFIPEKIYMGRLEKGADIIASVEEFCRERKIRAAWVNIIGALERATISYYDQVKHEYFHRELNAEYEIVSCSGNVSIKEEQPFAHLHIVLSDTQYQTLGGHLWPNTTAIFAAEFVLFELKPENTAEELKRCPDTETGLALW